MNVNRINKSEKKKYKCIWECQNCKTPCFPTTAESRCICGHRLRNHNENGIKHGCSEKNCGCKNFFYIPSEGSWMLRCRCKRKATEHDYRKPYKSTKPPLAGVICNGFDSPWVCNCNCSFSDHKQKFEEIEPFNPLLHFNPENFEGLMTSDIKRGDLMENIPGTAVGATQIGVRGSSYVDNNHYQNGNITYNDDNYLDNNNNHEDKIWNYDNNIKNNISNNNYGNDNNYKNNYNGNIQNTVFVADNDINLAKSMAQTRQIQQRKHEKQQPSKSIIKNSLALLKKKKSENLKNYC